MRAKLLESFRSDVEAGTPASFRRAALAAGVEARTARKAWHTGWDGVRPISESIEHEKLTARAALRREVLAQRADEAVRLAQEDATDERMLEGKSVRIISQAARANLLALHGERVFEYQKTLARLMQDELDPDAPVARAARKALREIGEIVRTSSETLATAQRMSALILGTPTAILGGEVGVKPLLPANVTSTELAQEVAAAERALTELRELEASTKPSSGGNGVAVPVHQPS